MFLLTAFHQNCVSLHFQKVESPLEFLGLYKTKHSACSWNNIPAKLISGKSTAHRPWFIDAGIQTSLFCLMVGVQWAWAWTGEVF